MIRSLCSIPGQELRSDVPVGEYAAILKNPKALQYAGKVLDPLIGKSMVLYFRKPDAA